MSFLSRLYPRARPLEPQAAYTAWAASYPPCAHNALMRVEQETVESLLRDLSPTCALDVGTGTGRNLGVLADAEIPRRVGVDLSQAMLARAPKNAPLVRGDARALPFAPGAFDVVVASLMVGDIEDLAGWALEMARVLRPGGSLLYSDFHPSWCERGWERTFRTADGVLRRVLHHPHTLEDHRSALASAGFTMVHRVEPVLVDVGDAPVCVIFQAMKRGT